MQSSDVLELLERVKNLESENTQLKTQAKSGVGLTMKVSQKGAISVYGMGRFPVTLYASQWERIDQELIQSGQLADFIDENRSSLASKK